MHPVPPPHENIALTVCSTGIVATEPNRVALTEVYHWKRQAMNCAADAIRGPYRNTVALKQENARLKKLVADQAIVIDKLKELNESVRRGKHVSVRSSDS